MKEKYKFFGVLLVMALVLMACPTSAGDDDSKGAGDKDTLFAEKGDGKLLVSNTSGDDMVLFYDTVQSNKVLGGISGNRNEHRIKLPSSGGTGAFYVIHAVKYADYKETPASEISNLKVVDSAFAYSDPNNDTSIQIGNPGLGGTAEIIFTNNTSSYIEIGDGSPHVEDRFFVLRPNSSNQKIYVNPRNDGYSLYYTVYIPMKKSGKIVGVQRSYVDAVLVNPRPGVPATKAINSTGMDAIIPDYRQAYVRILNNYTRGYWLENGSERLYSTLQYSIVAEGDEQVFEIDGGDGEGQTYSQLKLTTNVAGAEIAIPSFRVKNGFAYTVEITAIGAITISSGIQLDPENEDIPW
jgi:hypothetical protein